MPTLLTHSIVTPFTSTKSADFKNRVYSIGFEILDCGTATWCIQTKSQFDSNPGNTQTCLASSTCTTSEDLESCTSPSEPIVDNYLCLSRCPDGKFASRTGYGLSVCKDCASPCTMCFDTPTTCLRCILPYYHDIYQNSCVTECPSGYIPNSFRDCEVGVASNPLHFENNSLINL